MKCKLPRRHKCLALQSLSKLNEISPRVPKVLDREETLTLIYYRTTMRALRYFQQFEGDFKIELLSLNLQPDKVCEVIALHVPEFLRSDEM